MAQNAQPVLRTPAKQAKYRQRYGEILDAAAAVFADKGYHGASTKDIADRLGIRQGSLYYYFPSKEVALEEVCKIGVEGFVNRLSAIVEGDGTAADKVRAAVFNHLEPLRDRRDYVRVFLNERHKLTGEPHRAVGRLSRRYEQLLERLLSEAVAAGSFRRDLDCRVAVLALLGMCNTAADWHHEDGQRSLERIADAFADLFLGGVTAI